MKTIFILLAAICLYVLSCGVYAGWTGHGLVMIRTGFLSICLLVAVLLAILAFCVYQFIRKKRGEWRQWLSRTAILTIGWVVAFYITFECLSTGARYGSYFYWKTHKSEFESIALKQLERRQADGFCYVQTNEVAQLNYPVFIDINSSNNLQAVGFSHWATIPGRRGGYLFVKDAGERALNAIRTNSGSIVQLNTNWFGYGEYKPEIEAEYENHIRER
jgi:hypothetical protein